MHQTFAHLGFAMADVIIAARARTTRRLACSETGTSGSGVRDVKARLPSRTTRYWQLR
jgi:hypothetical protein